MSGFSDLSKSRKFVGRFPIPMLVLILGFGMAATFLDIVPNNMVGALFIMFSLGIALDWIGERIPIWNEYIGGGIVLVFMVVAWLVYMGWFPAGAAGTVDSMMEDWGFLNLYVCVLITGSILSIDRKLLIRSLSGVIPAIIGGLLLAGLLGSLMGMLVGKSVAETLVLYVIPIMGGGTGAGAVPMSEIFAKTTGQDPGSFMAVAYPILTIANILCILSGSLLNKLGQRKTVLTGNGKLIRKGGSLQEGEKKRIKIDLPEVAGGFTLAVVFFTLGSVLSSLTTFLTNGRLEVHGFAWMIILLTIFNIAGLIPDNLKQGAGRLQNFFVKWMTAPLMVGIGVAYINLGEMMRALNLANLLIAVVVVIGAMAGSALVGWLVGFYPIESAISSGLCMANRGGAGDIAVLGAAKRMDLLAYAQISSRIGGGIVLILAGFIFPLLSR